MDTQQTQIFTAVLIAAVLIGGIIAYFIYSLIRHQQHLVQLTQRSTLHQLSLLEKDRTRIAADLHDELSPLLTVLKLQVSGIQPANASDQSIMQKAGENIDFLAQRLREIAKDLMPDSLIRKGLIPALEDFISLCNKIHSLKIALIQNVEAHIPEDKAISIYRIIQEIAHNTIRHAKASKLLIRILQKKNTLFILCEDNGIGFDYEEKISAQSGLGLQTIKGRATLIGNKFVVHSVPGKGTQYTFEVPLKTSNE